MTVILSIKDIRKSYHRKRFLKDISLEVKKGERLGVLGDNGSGKSTLLSIVAGMNLADGGDILYCNQKIGKVQRRKISYVPQVPNLVEELSVKDNLRLWHNVYHLKDFDKTISEIPNFLGIEKMLKKKVSSLSGGMKKKVSIAVSLMNQPELLILDEPYAALDFKTIEAFDEHLHSLKDLTILFASHDPRDISKLCNRAIFMKEGIVVHYQEQELHSVEIENWYHKY